MEGKVVEFLEEGKPCLGICLWEQEGRLHLLTIRNREINLPVRRVLVASQKRYPLDAPRDALLQLLKDEEAKREGLKSQVDVKELWDTLKEEEALELKDLAELVFGLNIGDEHVSAVLRALFEDRVYFKLKDNVFSPVSPLKVEEHFQKLKEERRRQERIRRANEWLKGVISGDNTALEPDEDAISLLKQLALFQDEAKDYDLIEEIFQGLGGPDPKKARDILLKIGVWTEDEDLDLLRSSIPLKFPEDIQDEVFKLKRRRITLNGRKDLRDLQVFTIDGPKTRDFDDAISLEIKAKGYRLGVHITDTTHIFQPGSNLEKVLMERVSSLYLPTRYLPMMPQELSEDGLSLLEGIDRYAISLLVELDKDFQIQNWDFVPSVIRVTKQLTYDQVDQAMEYEEVFEILNKLSLHLKSERMEKGALDLTLPEVVITYRPDGRIDLFQVDMSSPSRRIVQEMMILYNQLAAQFLLKMAAPGLFRVQEGPTERLNQSEFDRVFYVFQQRRRLMPLSISTNPGPHVPLGVDCYVQATSPIRRYLDLVLQRQLKAILTGEALPYGEDELLNIKAATEPVLKEQEKVRRASHNHWILRYLEQNRQRIYHGLVLDDLRSRFRIVIKEVLFMVEARKDAFKGDIQPGDEILLKLNKVDPWTDSGGKLTGHIEVVDAC